MKVAFAGGGVVGRCYAEAFANQGVQVCGIWDHMAAPALLEFASTHAVALHPAAGDWLSQADVVISAVFGSEALTVAANAFPHMQAGALFIDMTTAEPEDMQRANRAAQDAGCHFVDVGIMGAVNLQGAKTPLLCAGARADHAAKLFARVGSPIQIVSPHPGDAATLKLLRSIFTKGLEALSVECLMTAERRGLRQQLHHILTDIDQSPLQTTMESMVCTHIAHASRRKIEVAQSGRQMLQAGVSPIVMPAVEQLFERTATAQQLSPCHTPDIEHALAWLIGSARLAAHQQPTLNRGELA